MKTLKYYCIVSMILFCMGCQNSNTQTITITDFSTVQNYKLVSVDNDRVVRLQLSIEGQVEGNVRISAGNCGGDFSGTVNFKQANDWYSSNAELLINPLVPTKGKLKIIVKFL